jgi:hypothetical protein
LADGDDPRAHELVLRARPKGGLNDPAATQQRILDARHCAAVTVFHVEAARDNTQNRMAMILKPAVFADPMFKVALRIHCRYRGVNTHPVKAGQ